MEEITDFKPLEHQKEQILFIRKLCKDKSESELVMIEENFKRFLCLTYRIVIRIQNKQNNLEIRQDEETMLSSKYPIVK